MTVQNAIASGLDVKSFAESVVPTGSKIAFICRNDIDESAYINNQMIEVALTNGTALSAIRYRGGGYQQQNGSAFTTAYDFRAAVGDTYTIFYQ